MIKIGEILKMTFFMNLNFDYFFQIFLLYHWHSERLLVGFTEITDDNKFLRLLTPQKFPELCIIQSHNISNRMPSLFRKGIYDPYCLILKTNDNSFFHFSHLHHGFTVITRDF